MRVAIIGTGELGGTLARTLGSHGHEVLAVSSRPAAETATTVAGWDGVRAADLAEVVGSDVVVLAVPHDVVPAVLAAVDLADHVLVDATNAWTEEAEPLEVDDPRGTTGAAVVAAQPAARVVKAFNTLPAERYVEDARERAATARRFGLPVAADDVHARDEIADLIGDAGFSAVTVGDLAEGARLMQPASPLFNVPLSAAELEARLGQLRV